MTIETHNSTETAAVLARAKAGEFRVLRMARGKRNASWTFTVFRAEPALFTLAVNQNAPTRQPEGEAGVIGRPSARVDNC
jgi:hypothetical protein